MIRRICALLLLSLFSFCSNPPKYDKTEELVLDKEIKQRLDSLKAHPELTQKENINPEAIHKGLQDLILLSKDVENLKASVELSERFFSQLVQNHQLNTSMLVELDSRMNPNEIALHLKQNELAILNQILLQKLNQPVILKSVY